MKPAAGEGIPHPKNEDQQHSEMSSVLNSTW